MSRMKTKPEQALQPGSTLPGKRRWKKESYLAMIVAAIPLLGFVIFNGFPLIISFIGMFFNINLNTISLDSLGDIQWNDFAAFKSVFVPGYANETVFFDISKYFYKSVWITLWIASTQLVTLLIALFIATLLREKFAGNKLFQILFFIPYICSTVAVSLMFTWIFNYEGGILNSILGTDINWLYNEDNPATITWCIIIAIIWQAPGYGIVMYKAAFSNINNSLYEAAELDGANAWHRFRHVTLPGISPTTFFLLQAGVSAGLLTFDLAALLAPTIQWSGMPGGYESMGLTLMRLVHYLIDERGTKLVFVSCACVISWLLFIVTGIISMIMFRQREKSLK